jgi:hypothetical protein
MNEGLACGEKPPRYAEIALPAKLRVFSEDGQCLGGPCAVMSAFISSSTSPSPHSTLVLLHRVAFMLAGHVGALYTPPVSHRVGARCCHCVLDRTLGI